MVRPSTSGSFGPVRTAPPAPEGLFAHPPSVLFKSLVAPHPSIPLSFPNPLLAVFTLSLHGESSVESFLADASQYKSVALHTLAPSLSFFPFLFWTADVAPRPNGHTDRLAFSTACVCSLTFPLIFVSPFSLTVALGAVWSYSHFVDRVFSFSTLWCFFFARCFSHSVILFFSGR